MPYILPYIYSIEHPTLYTTLPYPHTLHLLYRTPYLVHYPTIPSYPVIILHLPYRTPYPVYNPAIYTIIPYISPYIYRIEQPTLFTTLPYYHTLYIILHLICTTIPPSVRVFHHGGIPCIPPYHTIIPYTSP